MRRDQGIVMLRINEVKVPVRHTEKDIENRLLNILHIRRSELVSWRIAKESIDARKKPELFYVYSIDAKVADEKAVLKRKLRQVQKRSVKQYVFPKSGEERLAHRPYIVGSGPAGLFCAYLLAEHGYRPALIERGAPVEERMRDVERFWKEGILDPESNVQFGEGGAGTFSDGKLNTLVKDADGRNRKVLEIFVQNGAPKEILYQNRPHIGTDLLTEIVRSMRLQIEAWGGDVRFHSKFTGFKAEEGKLCSIEINHSEEIPADVLVFAPGHSARDTFEMLAEKGMNLQPKAFAVGVRCEHPQEMIDHAQYGDRHPKLPAASYKLTARTDTGRGVYSFCMCPGGYVVNAASEPEMTAVNGMSYHGRSGKHANSAIVVTVDPKDFGTEGGVLAGMEFQRRLERAAYRAGDGKIPVQRLEDFKKNQRTTAFGSMVPEMKGACSLANLRDVLPEYISDSICQGFDLFDRKIPGFAMPDALLSGVESRTSSPVKIPRDESFQSMVSGIYPCGEGAGYAGGITSAAMDGIRIAEVIAARFCPVSSK